MVLYTQLREAGSRPKEKPNDRGKKMKNCEICKKSIDRDDEFKVNGKQTVCFECANELAKRAKLADRGITITHGEYEENWHLCEWCNELMPEDDLQEEFELGYLCYRCICGISARGETLWLKY